MQCGLILMNQKDKLVWWHMPEISALHKCKDRGHHELGIIRWRQGRTLNMFEGITKVNSLGKWPYTNNLFREKIDLFST